MQKPKFDLEEKFEVFLDSLDSKGAAKLLTVIENIEKHGLIIAKKNQWVKKLQYNLYEIRVNAKGNALRGIYFQIESNSYFITHGFRKKTSKTPRKELQLTKSIRDKFFKNKGSE